MPQIPSATAATARLRYCTHTHTHTLVCLSPVQEHTHRASCVCVLQNQVVDSGSGLTQGDKLRALKSRRPPRYSTTGAVRYQILDKRGSCWCHFRAGSFKPHVVFQVGGDGDPGQIGLTAPQVSCLSQRVKTSRVTRSGSTHYCLRSIR